MFDDEVFPEEQSSSIGEDFKLIIIHLVKIEQKRNQLKIQINVLLQLENMTIGIDRLLKKPQNIKNFWKRKS